MAAHESHTQNQYNATRQNANLTAPSPSPPIEKDFGDIYHLDNTMSPENALRKIQTSGSISVSPELFEKIYLSPQNRVSGDLRKKFANPTPLALCGFLLSLTPMSCDLMGWRGAGGGGAASTGVFFYFGGLLMILGSIGEFFLGNTFPFVVFGSFGAFWLSYATTLVPFYNAWGAYSSDPSNPVLGLTSDGFEASFGFFFLFMGFLCFLYMILALRTNIVFFGIFIMLAINFACLAGAYWHMAQGSPKHVANTLLVTAGATTFVADLLGWWIFMAILLASLDFPFQLPVGDLSRFIKGASEIEKKKREAESDALYDRP